MWDKLFFEPTPMSYEGIDLKEEDCTECYPDAEE